jgi:3',5'-cyclic AMP phosphodiesterase CpdA
LAAIEETNELEPDLVIVAGDLTAEDYRWEFEEPKIYLERIERPTRGRGNGQPRRQERRLQAL